MPKNAEIKIIKIGCNFLNLNRTNNKIASITTDHRSSLLLTIKFTSTNIKTAEAMSPITAGRSPTNAEAT